MVHNFIMSHNYDDFVQVRKIELHTMCLKGDGRRREIREENNAWVELKEQIAQQMQEDL